MNPRRLATTPFTALLALALMASPLAAQSSNQPKLYKAYYLEREAGEYAQAKALYDKVLGAKVSSEVRQSAQAGSDRCRDALAARDFTVLMPEDALAYIELNRPGQLFEKLADMLGLTGKSIQEVLAQRPSAEAVAPFYIPKEIVISPAIFEVLSGFGGAGVAITDFDPECDGPPSGVMVVHHGDAALLKGMLETAFQFSPTSEKIKGMPTFGVNVPDAGKITGVLTESLLIVGTGRDLVEGVVDRLTGAETASLATRDDLSEIVAERRGATLFAYVDLQRTLKIIKAHLPEEGHDAREFAVANAIADLDSLRWAAFSFGIHDGELGAQLAVRLADNHRSIAYNLMRLPPMTRRCLAKVPPDAAAFFGLGLNPALTLAAAGAAGGEPGNADITGMDLFREFFGNIQEICAFVIPGKMGKPEGPGGPDFIPNVGIVLAVNDATKSAALWNQILSIPGLVGGDEPITPRRIKIGKTPVTAYAIPEFAKVYMAELDGCVAIGLTRSAMKASIRTHNKERSILDDEVMSKVIARMPSGSSLMMVAHIGRLADVAAGSGGAGVAMVATQARELCSEMIAWAGVGQAPNEFTLRCAVSGLPNVNKALEKFGPMANTFAQFIPMGQGGRRGGVDQKVTKLTGKVIASANKEDYETALRYALEAREIADIGLCNYNVACMYSLLGEDDKAFEYLFRAAEQGLDAVGTDIVEKLKSDSDLDNIRGDPRFEKALAIAGGETTKTAKAAKHAKKTRQRPARKVKTGEL